MTATKTEIETLVDQIGTGARPADQGLFKGLKDGFNKLLGLAKAKPPPAKDDEDEDDEDDEDEPPAGPGMDKMGKGRQPAKPATPPASPDSFEGIDGTELLAALHKSRVDDAKQIKTLRKLVKGLHARIDTLEANNAEAQIAVLAPLAKAIGNIEARILSTPALSLSEQTERNAAALDRLTDPPKAGGGVQIPMATLVKARMSGILNETDMRYYSKTGKFRPDDAQNAEIVKRVQAA